MATRKQIMSAPVSGHPTIKKIYVLQILETSPEVVLLHEEIPQGSFELLLERGHLKQFFPVDYSKIPQGALPIIEYFEIL
jgi:hypothetical protein